MKIVNTTYICDLCGHKDNAGGRMTYTFTTEITVTNADPEGHQYILVPGSPGERGFTGPIKVDLCHECLEKLLKPITDMDRKKRGVLSAY